MTSDDVYERIPDLWWCDDHNAVHEGGIERWAMEHRENLRPLFALVR